MTAGWEARGQACFTDLRVRFVGGASSAAAAAVVAAPEAGPPAVGAVGSRPSPPWSPAARAGLSLATFPLPAVPGLPPRLPGAAAALAWQAPGDPRWPGPVSPSARPPLGRPWPRRPPVSPVLPVSPVPPSPGCPPGGLQGRSGPGGCGEPAPEPGLFLGVRRPAGVPLGKGSPDACALPAELAAGEVEGVPVEPDALESPSPLGIFLGDALGGLWGDGCRPPRPWGLPPFPSDLSALAEDFAADFRVLSAPVSCGWGPRAC